MGPFGLVSPLRGASLTVTTMTAAGGTEGEAMVRKPERRCSVQKRVIPVRFVFERERFRDVTLPSPRVQASVELPDAARIRAVFHDGSEVDLTSMCAQLVALGAQVAIESIGSVPILADELGDVSGVEGLDAVIDHVQDDSAGRVELIDGDDALFVLHHVGGDEMLTTEAALTLMSLAAAALIEDADSANGSSPSLGGRPEFN